MAPRSNQKPPSRVVARCGSCHSSFRAEFRDVRRRLTETAERRAGNFVAPPPAQKVVHHVSSPRRKALNADS
jgi:hypothetical protein